jgi:hypothetical protein
LYFYPFFRGEKRGVIFEQALIIERWKMSTLQVKTELPFDELLNAVEQLNLPDLEQLMSQVITLQARRKAPSLSKNESEY